MFGFDLSAIETNTCPDYFDGYGNLFFQLRSETDRGSTTFLCVPPSESDLKRDKTLKKRGSTKPTANGARWPLVSKEGQRCTCFVLSASQDPSTGKCFVTSSPPVSDDEDTDEDDEAPSPPPFNREK